MVRLYKNQMSKGLQYYIFIRRRRRWERTIGLVSVVSSIKKRS